MKLLLCLFAVMATAMSKPDLEAVLKKSSDQFSAHMFQEVVKSQGDKNCVLSAFSVLSPLAELASASVGQTQDEILKAIGFPNNNVTKQVFADLNKRLRSVKGIELDLANKIYVRDDYSLDDKFAALSKEVFDSEFENIDFKHKEKAAAEINEWIEDHTHKRIKKLVDPDSIDKDTAAILVNAIYFEGKWKKPFSKYSTYDRTFHVSGKLKRSVPTMYQVDEFKYAESKKLDAKFLEMEYKGGETSLIVALPNKIDGINHLIKKFRDPSALNEAIKNMKSNHVRVSLPKFKIETTTNLIHVLEKMDIKKLFQKRQAQLYNLLKERKDLYVSGATQKAFIEVKEEGVEAAVVNDFGLAMPSSLQVTYYMNEKEFNADHPFLFFIMEKNNILFSGVFRS